MSNKVIAWDGTALHLVIFIAIIYGLSLLLANYAVSEDCDDPYGRDDPGNSYDFECENVNTYPMVEGEFYILASICFLLAAYRSGAILMYEGWKEDDYKYVVPNKTLIIDVIIILITLYLFLDWMVEKYSELLKD